MNFLKARKGFTLIELLIVITIIGVLAVALVPRIVGAPAKARDAARKADLQQIATGLELYADANGGSYPTEHSSNCLGQVASSLSGSYLTTVPEDPQPVASSECSTGYTYSQTADGYFLSAQMETATAASDNNSIFAAVAANGSSDTSAQIPSASSNSCDGSSTACYYYVIR